MTAKKRTAKTSTTAATTTEIAQLDGIGITMQNVPDLLAKIEESISNIKGDDCTIELSSKSLPGFGPLESLTVNELVNADAYLTRRAIAYKEALNRHELDSKKYSDVIEGYSSEQWLKSIANQIKITKNKEQLDKLNQAKETLKKYVSKESQLQMDLKGLLSL